MSVLTKVFGDEQKKKIKQLEKAAAKVSELADDVKKLSDSELKAKTDEFKARLEKGENLDNLLSEAYAVVREAAERVLGMRHYDVQVMAGIALHQGSVAEQRTGEGKTLMATLPLYLNAITGKGAHLVTVNDYLAQRDAGWNGELFDFMGLSTAVIIAQESYIFDSEYENSDHDDPRFKRLKPCTRQEAYAADITYGTNNEFGFDYLRDNMVREVDQLRQRPLHYAIVDEVDSILIDEARTPLIISAPAMNSGSSYGTFASVARRLNEEHYEVDEKRKSAALTDDGVAKVQEYLGVDNLYAPENVRMIYHMDQALRAETLFKRDKDYVVNEDGEVIIVDEFTGRLMHGRRYNEGLHQAIEAKEGVEVLQESMTLATISFQNYFRLYEKLAGMTGTAMTEAEEFYQIYKLDAVEIPTNKPSARDDQTDRIYKTKKGKFNAIVNEVKELQEQGSAVLIGTSSIENNEVLSRLLAKAGVSHNVLNAKHHEEEAAIVAKAGKAGAVTLATNIAGRGTDIVLDNEVKEKGGLHVIGSERHESRRIDNQLRGRSGRQGDPGFTQFYVSVEDDLMRIFGGDRIGSLMERLGVDEETPIENKSISKALENAQKKVESHNFDTRKHVVQYDDVMNRHRKATYTLRQEILGNEDISDKIQSMIDEEIAFFTPGEDEKAKDIAKDTQPVFNLKDADIKKLEGEKSAAKYQKTLSETVEARYKEQEKAFGVETMRRVEKEAYLQVLDNLWMQHLENMGHLREGINWRSVGQKDPLVEYRREGQRMFETMQAETRGEVIRSLFHARPVAQEELEEPIETELTRAAAQSIESGVDESGGAKSRKSAKKGKDDNQSAGRVAAVTEEEEKAEKRKKRAASKKKKAKRKKGRR
jgi:preprotein translocase subunit SecA